MAERSWVIVHSDHGPYVIGCLCRPPAPGEIDSFRSLKEELHTHSAKAVGSVVLGVLNVHHRRWLKFSNRNRWEGEELCSICKELIREPTRGEHLLDLVLSSVPEMKTEVLLFDCRPQTRDCYVEALVAISCRGWTQGVWRYRQADWERLRDMLDDTCWKYLKGLSTTVAAKWVMDTVLRAAETCIPLTTLRARKSSHPWLIDRAVALVDA